MPRTDSESFGIKEVEHRSGHQELAFASMADHSRGDMDLNASYVACDRLELAPMSTDSQFDAESPCPFAHSQHRLHCARRVEPGPVQQESISGGLEFSAGMICDRFPDSSPKLFQQLLPRLVAKFAYQSRRADYVAKDHGSHKSSSS